MKLLQSLLTELMADDNKFINQRKSTITRAEVSNILADNMEQAKSAIDQIFSTATDEEKSQALKIWIALNKNKIM